MVNIVKQYRSLFPKPRITTANVKDRRAAVRAGDAFFINKQGKTVKLTPKMRVKTMRNVLNQSKNRVKVPFKKKPVAGLGSGKVLSQEKWGANKRFTSQESFDKAYKDYVKSSKKSGK